MNIMKDGFKSGFVAVIGRPNVGKSTLINSMMGEKVSIISSKPQTTRNNIRAILTTDDYQLVFIDTPGIHKPKNMLGEYMVKSAQDTLNEVDVVVYVVEAGSGIGTGDRHILRMLENISTPVILAINKIDKSERLNIESLIDEYSKAGNFSDIIPVSAQRGDYLNILRGAMVEKLPEGPMYFPEGMVTDHPEKFIIAETIREKALNLLDQEIPHGIAVDIERLEDDEQANLIKVYANIYCEKESHKRIIIGKGGEMLKRIGSLARADIENLFGARVYLNLWVKVKKDWRDRAGSLHLFGYQ
jgi:GTP-binding protein Era